MPVRQTPHATNTLIPHQILLAKHLLHLIHPPRQEPTFSTMFPPTTLTKHPLRIPAVTHHMSVFVTSVTHRPLRTSLTHVSVRQTINTACFLGTCVVVMP